MEWAVISQPGSREVNEDSTGIVEGTDAHCFVVADGLGGHGMGDIASRLAVDAFGKVFPQHPEPLPQRLSAAFLQAQEDILAEQVKSHAQAQMKTTVVALAVTDREVAWGHIGDSRLYSFRWGWCRKRTEDHSVPQMLVHAREIRQRQIRFHPDRNKLLRVLGVAGVEPRFQLSPVYRRRKGQAFLLCSDGFWELILEKEMASCLRQAASPQDWLEKMEKIILARGEGTEMDNLSAIGVWL